jgi:hypothetical protein
MSDQPTRSRLRRAGGTALRILFPFSAMRQSAELARREMDRTKSNLIVLRELGQGARDAIAGPKAGDARNESFDEAMARRRPDAMTAPELRSHFLWRKRIAIGAAVVFLVSSTRDVVLGAACGLGGQPLMFVIALGAQLRLWQLDNHRLSVSERGGLRDFMRECPGWLRATLNPEFHRRPTEEA